MEIIKFSNGKYGIRKTYFFGLIKSSEYLDLTDPEYEWDCRDEFFQDCQSQDLEKVKNIFKRLQNKVEKV